MEMEIKKGLIFAAILYPCSSLPTINASDTRTWNCAIVYFVNQILFFNIKFA